MKTAVPPNLAASLRRLSRRQKAALADHLWREAEKGVEPTGADLGQLDARAAEAVSHPQRLRPLGTALKQIRR